MNLRAIAFCVASLLCAASAHADRIFADGLEIPVPPSQFPLVDGQYRIPSGPAADQLAWIIGELKSTETTTPAEISAHFTSAFDPNSTASFFATLRGLWPNAVVADVIGVTPVDLTVLINTPGGGAGTPSAPSGFLRLQAQYTGGKLTTLFSVSNFSGSVMYAEDQSLTLAAQLVFPDPVAGETYTLMRRADQMPVFEVAPTATSADDPRVYRTTVRGVRNPVAEYLAAVDPTTVLGLLDRIAELEAQLAAQSLPTAA